MCVKADVFTGLFIVSFVLMADASVSCQDNVTDQGQLCYKITTASATYWYQKEGCGFSSIHDKDGNDWIDYKPTGGASGHYRGIPNMGLDAFGHPGYANGASTTLVSTSDSKVILKSHDSDGWEVLWEFYDDRAVLIVNKAPLPYWFLYEGTPGGRMEPDKDYYYVPDKSVSDGVGRFTANQSRNLDLSPEWIAFGDPALSRMLVLVHHNDDQLQDDYYPMGGEGGMTVFGFGRDNDKATGCWYCLDRKPDTFTVALVETVSEGAVKTFAESAIKGVTVGLTKKENHLFKEKLVVKSVRNGFFIEAAPGARIDITALDGKGLTSGIRLPAAGSQVVPVCQKGAYVVSVKKPNGLARKVLLFHQ
jgi:hypothetical protein